jgi:hypothetical protein
LFGQTFYHSLIRKYVILVGTLFNDIYIQRTNSSNTVTGLLKVPITYGPRDKMLARITQDAAIDRPSATMPLPLISFEMGQMRYDKDRKLNTINRVSIKDNTDPNKFRYKYNYVPYNIDFKVYIYAKNTEDGTKIIEQVLPFFTPDWTTTVNLIPDTEEVKDIPIILNSVKYEDNYSGDFKERRAIIWTLDLVLKGYLYGPIKKSGIIKFVNVNFYIPSVPDGKLSTAVGNTSISEKITVQPGLTANGQPTSDINQTIPYTQIEIDDDYGFITQIYNEEDLI